MIRLVVISLFASLAACDPAYDQTEVDPVEISMVDLERAIDENEVGALEKYKGKPLLISGKVISVLLGSDNEMSVNMEGSGFLPVAVPLPDQDKPVAGTLRKGTLIAVTCYGLDEIMAKPALSDCRLNPTSDWPTAG